MKSLIDTINTTDGLFHNRNKETGELATIVTADYMNDNQAAVRDMQQEMAAVLADAGFKPDNASTNQLLKSIKSIMGTNAFLISNLLSEAKDAGAAAQATLRENIGLGTAATYTAQTSKTDATANRLMVVGAFGLGGAETGIPDGTNIYKFFATAKSGNCGGGGNLPSSLTSGWRSFKWQQHGSDNKYGTLLEFGSDGKAALHVYNNANGDMTNPENYWSNHGLFYGEKNKPSAADVGALSTGGGTLSGQLTVSGTGHGSYASQRDAGAPVYQLVDSTSTSEYWPIIKQKYKQKNSAWSLGMLINANRFNVYYSDPTQSNDKSWSFNADGTFVPPNYSNFDAKYQAKLSGPLPVSSGGTGSTTAAGARTNLGCGTAATMSYSTAAYTQLAGSPTEAASTKQLVGLRDAVYTKTAGDARYQLKNTASKAASGWFKDTTTGIITQWQKIQTTTASDNSFTFPIAFPNANLGCVGTVMDQSNPDAGVRTVKIASRTKTGFNCTTVNGSGHMACPVFVYSVGY